ncbi:MAG: hypothetical protein V4459_11760 [Pseudomonadota bacterium]
MAQPPNLNDPAELAAYRQELRGVARGVRLSGVTLAVVGALIAIARAWWMPSIPKLVTLIVIAAAVMLMLTGVALRAAYHKHRMAGGAS